MIYTPGSVLSIVDPRDLSGDTIKAHLSSFESPGSQG